MARGSPEYQEGAAGVGLSWEDYTEVGSGAGCLIEVLSCGDTGGVFFWADMWVLLAPMAQRLEVVHVGILRQVKKLKKKG